MNTELNDKKLRFRSTLKLLPNIVTLTGVCFGLTSLKHTFAGNLKLAVIFLIIAAVIDAIDGRIARLLKSTSEFGAQLDSLADFLNFGVAPAFLLYFWELKNIKIYGWWSVMLLVVCTALRLARFNISTQGDNDEDYKNNFIVGVPAPIGALLSLMPLMLTFSDNIFPYSNEINHQHIMLYQIIIATLIISRVPTFSLKPIIIHNNLLSVTTILIGITIILMIIQPWITVPLIGFWYLSSIPVTSYIHWKNTKLM